MHLNPSSTARRTIYLVLGTLVLLALATVMVGQSPTAQAMQAGTGTPAATTAATRAATVAATSATTATVTSPTLPAPVAVQLDPKTTALLVLDVTDTICKPRPACVATVPVDAALLKKARDAGAMVAYSDTGGTTTVLPDVAPASGEPKVSGRADKFFNTTLDELLKAKGIKTVVIVGYVANGAVLYTAFGANARGYTAVVPVDGTGAEDPFIVQFVQYQLLNQPGFSNPTNQALIEGRVTLSKSDLITFVAGAPGPKPAATAAAPAGTAQPTAAATAAATRAATTGATAAATRAATVAPTTAATVVPTAAPTTASSGGSTGAAATGSAVCLGCHGPFDKLTTLVKYKTDAGETIAAHRYVPHDQKGADSIPTCTNCHTAHPIPPTGKVDLSKVNVDWCYDSCHHQRNFTPCKTCH